MNILEIPPKIDESVPNHGLLALVAKFLVVDCEHEECSHGLAGATECCHHDAPFAAQNWVGNVIGQSSEDTRKVRKVARDRFKLNGQIAAVEVNHGQTVKVYVDHFKKLFTNSSLGSTAIWKTYPFIGLRALAKKIYAREMTKDRGAGHGFLYQFMMKDDQYGVAEKQMIKVRLIKVIKIILISI